MLKIQHKNFNKDHFLTQIQFFNTNVYCAIIIYLYNTCNTKYNNNYKNIKYINRIYKIKNTIGFVFVTYNTIYCAKLS